MKQIICFLLVYPGWVFGQTGQIQGIVTDDAGAPVKGAVVTASLRSSTKQTLSWNGAPVFMPVMPIAKSTVTGAFQIDELLQGRYTLCVTQDQGTVVDPCLWSDAPVTLAVASGSVVQGLKIIAPRSRVLSIRVQDPNGLLAANPAADDIRIGTYYKGSPFIPARVQSTDSHGKTMSLSVLPGQPVSVSISSSAFALADDAGNPLKVGETFIPVPTAIPVGASAVTIQITASNKPQ